MALYEEFERRPNRLIDAQSRYLRDAAYQPVGWYEYGDEAFAEARRQHKPVFLDIGASWCHWCHVIDRESYENPEIATLLNELFIPIKVDRDERPDIDARYQTAVQLLTGQGGWPLTVFLTPDGLPFYGGTYFPPRDAQGHFGLRTLLPRLARTWREHRDDLLDVAETVSEHTAQAHIHALEPGAIDEETYHRLAGNVLQRFNVEDGGFEHTAPKFPHPGAIDLALLELFRTGSAPWHAVVTTTLKGMAYGGIYDQLGGGFHRYAIDAHWSVPHFEKLGAYNGLLLGNYARAFRATGFPLFREIAAGMFAYLFHVLSDRELGGFYNAQDADAGANDDGRYWTWTQEEFLAALSPGQAEVMTRYYGVSAEGNMPEGARNVLRVSETPEAIARAVHLPLEEVQRHLTRGNGQLLQARLRRRAPAVDTTLYINGNALLISGCLEAGLWLEQAEATELALRAADRLLREAYDESAGMYHTLTPAGARLPGLLEDQVYMATALLDAYTVSGAPRYLSAAQRLLDLCLERYWDRDLGGFLDTAAEHAVTDFLHQPRKMVEDLPTPSPNAVAALALGRLAALTGEARYREFAENTLGLFSAHAPEYGPLAAYYGLAVYFHLHPPALVTILGHADEAAAEALRQAALHAYRPGRQVVLLAPETRGLPFPPADGGAAIAYVCAGQACAPPTTDPETLRRTVETFGLAEE